MAQEKSYISLLKETAMLNTHVGSGPKDPASKEKETKSPDEDSKGEGTQQAGTKDPNKIPAISSLKKDLAKEGVSNEVLEDESFIPMLEAIFSHIGNETLRELIKTRKLPTRVAKYMTNPGYRERAKDLTRLRKAPSKAKAMNYGRRKDKYSPDVKKRILKMQPQGTTPFEKLTPEELVSFI